MLIRNHQLNPLQLLELDELCVACKAQDGNNIAVYKHLLSQPRPRLCNILYYHQKQLIGFLSTFFFFEDTCEVSIMVRPDFRRQNIATQMVHDILPLIRSEEIKTLIFSSPHDVNNEALSVREFHYQHCEYLMQRHRDQPAEISNHSLVVRPATINDLAFLCAVDNICFTIHQPDTPIHFQKLLYDPNYRLFVSELNGEPIGKAHLDLQPENTRITDIAILPPYQGQGFGSAMLAHCINYSLANHQPNLILNVETKNQQALKIYTRLGFVINNAYDFWSIPIEVLRFAKH